MFLVPEVEWDDAERAWIDALRWYREEYLCPCGCGWPRAVTMDPATENGVDIPAPAICWISRRLSLAQHDWSDAGGEMSGLLWSARLKDQPRSTQLT